MVALVFPVALGASQSWAFSTDWPNASSFIAIFRPLADHGNGRLLVEDAAIARYYLPSGKPVAAVVVHPQHRLAVRRQHRRPGQHRRGHRRRQRGCLAEFITRGYFSLVALNFADTTALDRQIAADLRRSPHYRIIDVVPYGVGPGPAHRPRHLRHLAIRAAP